MVDGNGYAYAVAATTYAERSTGSVAFLPFIGDIA